MHPTRLFHEHDPDLLVQTANTHPFALVIGVQSNRPYAAHAPVLVEQRAETIDLRFHLSRMNPVTDAIQATGRALVVFTGPHTYVSPDWYGQDDQVPTWNYLSVEAEGPLQVLDDAGAARLLDDLSATYEAELTPKPAWTRGKMTPGRFESMLKGITAFEMAATRFEGIRKLNQNKPVPARERVISALESREDGLAIAREMRKLDT